MSVYHARLSLAVPETPINLCTVKIECGAKVRSCLQEVGEMSRRGRACGGLSRDQCSSAALLTDLSATVLSDHVATLLSPVNPCPPVSLACLRISTFTVFRIDNSATSTSSVIPVTVVW